MPIAQTLPPLEEAQRLAYYVARSLARREADIDDLVQIGLIAYHQDFDRHTNVRKPWALAKTILRRAMILYYSGYRADIKKWHEVQSSNAWKRDTPLDDLENSEGEEQQNIFDELELESYYAALEKECGCTARVFAENLIAPTNPCIAGYLLWKSRSKLDQRAAAAAEFEGEVLRLTNKIEVAKRKKSSSEVTRLRSELYRLRRRYKNVVRRTLPRGGGKHHTIRVSASDIAEAMGMSSWQLLPLLKRIREFTAAWLARNGSTRSTELQA